MRTAPCQFVMYVRALCCNSKQSTRSVSGRSWVRIPQEATSYQSACRQNYLHSRWRRGTGATRDASINGARVQNTTLVSIIVRGPIIDPSCWPHVATHRVARYRPAMCDAPWPRACRSATRGARTVANPQRVMFVGDAHTYRTATSVGRHVRRCA